MHQDWAGNPFHVVGLDEVPSVDRCHRLGCAKQGDRRTGTATQCKIFVIARVVNDLHQVLPNFDVDVHLADRLLAGDQVGGRTSSIESHGFRFDLGPTFFLYPRVLREIFAACGRSQSDSAMATA